MSINQRIRQLRQTFDLTQAKFAKRISISESYFAGIERGDKTANERITRLISTEFGISEHWLRTGEGEMYNSEEDVQIAQVTSLFKSLIPKYRQCALSQINALADLQNADK